MQISQRKTETFQGTNEFCRLPEELHAEAGKSDAVERPNKNCMAAEKSIVVVTQATLFISSELDGG
jgi:hypothetical protein